MNKRTLSIGALSILLIILLILIESNLIEPFDLGVYYLIAPHINPSLTSFVNTFTSLGNGISIIVYCFIAIVITYIMKKRNVGIVLTVCVGFNYIVSEVLKIIIQRPRPEILQLVNESSYSFPSGHALVSFSLCGMLIYIVLKSELNQSLKIALSTLLVIFPILIAVSRVYLGVHNASDVIGGAIIAIILLLIETSIIEKNELF